MHYEQLYSLLCSAQKDLKYIFKGMQKLNI